MNIEQFLKDRKKAMLSMDKKVILKYMKKYDVPIPEKDSVFWVGVHKARTADGLLPMWERCASKYWLIKRGLSPMDDGDVLPFFEVKSHNKKYSNRIEEFEKMNFGEQ